MEIWIFYYFIFFQTAALYQFFGTPKLLWMNKSDFNSWIISFQQFITFIVCLTCWIDGRRRPRQTKIWWKEEQLKNEFLKKKKKKNYYYYYYESLNLSEIVSVNRRFSDIQYTWIVRGWMMRVTHYMSAQQQHCSSGSLMKRNGIENK